MSTGDAVTTVDSAATATDSAVSSDTSTDSVVDVATAVEGRVALHSWANEGDDYEDGDGDSVSLTTDEPSEHEMPDPDAMLREARSDSVYEAESDLSDRLYDVQSADGPVDLPEDLTFRYKADGEVRERTLDELIQFAQKGENFDRRSRALAEESRHLRENARRWYMEQSEALAAAQEQFYAQVRMFFEDPEYREEALEEYERLTSNPEEIELRRRAQQADELERRLGEYRKREIREWQRGVWATVDQIINESRAEYPLVDANSVRREFARAFHARGREVMSEPFLKELIRMEHEKVAGPLSRVRAESESRIKELERRLKELEALNKNNRVANAIAKKSEGAKATPGRHTDSPRKSDRPRSMREASNALKAWGNS